MPAHHFELVAGHPVLDFLNTIHDWTVPHPRDYLGTFGAAIHFGVQAGVLTQNEGRRLAPAVAGPELRRLRALRARLERVFRAALVAHPRPADLDDLARDAADAARAVRLRADRNRIVREVPLGNAGGAALRLRLVDSAVQLLTSASLNQLKSCPSCGWFFLDSSKNRSRRWCSMATCGSNAKARRYYWRTKSRTGVRHRP